MLSFNGYPAISLPLLEVEVTCKVVPAESPWRLYEEDTLSMAVYASLEYLDIKESCIRCEIDSAIPEKRGMGSVSGYQHSGHSCGF